MEKQLNLERVKEAMDRKGVNPATLARELDVSREAVSRWLQGKSLPRPDKLLKLALRLDLQVDQVIVRPDNDSEPVVAFRKMGARKTTKQHIAHAKDIGRLLRRLVPYLPFDKLVRPATLKKPNDDYRYIQDVVSKFRKEIGVRPDDAIDFHHLINRFGELQAVLVPVLWGKKDRHENALHIFLPDSMTTWVYLNIDSEIHDFKFWMTHELGHILAPELRGDIAEDFADAFAGALLFPGDQAARAWEHVHAARSEGAQINRIKGIAEASLISPISVYREINKYAIDAGLRPLSLDPAIYGAAKNLSKAYHNVSTTLFDDNLPGADEYIDRVEKLFQSPFVAVLKQYLIKEAKGPGYIQSILDIPLLDARELHRHLA